MLSLFKSNNPVVIILYLFYIILFRICFFFSTPDTGFVFAYHEPLSRILFSLLQKLPFNYAATSVALSGLLCLVQALIVNNIVSENKILARSNYLAGIFFIIFSSFFKASLVLSPASVALTFLLVATGKIFSLIRKEKSFGDVFDAGMLVALATLFYFPSILFIVFAYIALGTVRPFTYREWVIIFMGFFCPFFIAFTCYVWAGQTGRLWQDISNAQARGWLTGLNKFTASDYMMLGWLLLCILAALAFLPNALFSSLIQVRKFSTTLIFFIFLVVIAFTLQQRVNLSHFIWMALPLSIFTSMIIFPIRRKWISEVVHLMLILLVLTGQYLPIFKILN